MGVDMPKSKFFLKNAEDEWNQLKIDLERCRSPWLTRSQNV